MNTLHIVWDMKKSLRREARLVVGGNLVDILIHKTHYSTIKGVSIKLLHVIAKNKFLNQLRGNISNAYVNDAYTNEKAYAFSGKKIRDIEGSVVLIRKASYGIVLSS